MEELWDRQQGTVREVMEGVNARAEAHRAYTTILTVMQRLFVKELLRREPRGRKHVYVPALSREEYARARATAEVGALVSEFGDVALAQFSRHMSELSPERREQIRRLGRRA